MNKTIVPMPKYRFNAEEHLHFLGDKALTGTSSVVNVLAKNLTWWAAETSAVECLEAGEKIPTIREEYLTACASSDKKSAIDALQKKYPLFKKARFAHFADKNKKAEKGTDLHAELEKFVKSEMGKKKYEDKDFEEKIQPFIKWSRENVKKYLASEAHTYSEKMFVGGITDAVAEMNDGKIAVIDFKSSKEAYASQFIQTAGYALQIEENGLFSEDGKFGKMVGLIEKLIIVPFGAAQLVPEVREFLAVNEYERGFEAAVKLYRILGMDEQIKENTR